jgi:single-stranded-DNA-specific exonuclease
LLSEALPHSRALARELTALNDERRTIEAGMHQQAMQTLAKMDFAQNLPAGLCIFDETWHQGVVGILASKIKDKFQRPVIAFAAIGEDEIKGSARSVAGLHMRDLLDKIATQNPGLIIRFGGHAMAAGVTMRRADYERFSTLFVDEVNKHFANEGVQSYIYSDGELPATYFSLETAEMLQKAGPWGHGFAAPLFDGVFELVQQRLVGEKHLKMTVRLPENQQEVNAICFNVDLNSWPNYRCQKVHLAYRLEVNEYNGRRNLQLMVDKMAAYSTP